MKETYWIVEAGQLKPGHEFSSFEEAEQAAEKLASSYALARGTGCSGADPEILVVEVHGRYGPSWGLEEEKHGTNR